ncbi:MAG TPA: hypothetical protein VGD10_10410 [Allosphingosinicella sp.]|uniref:hypothetical protein n=1 Tax=Allosphingosinicella sp. TaxID=2823234 RepID=UPI002ED8A8CF
MDNPAVGGFSQFLNYGGLGLLAILCLVVLGYNAWSLNRLVATSAPAKVNAARPLLLAQMAVSLIGLFVVGAGAVYLENIKDRQTRMAQIIIDPWERNIDSSFLPDIRLAGKPLIDRPINITCTPGSPTTVTVDLDRFIAYRISKSIEAQRALPPVALSSR